MALFICHVHFRASRRGQSTKGLVKLRQRRHGLEDLGEVRDHRIDIVMLLLHLVLEWRRPLAQIGQVFATLFQNHGRTVSWGENRWDKIILVVIAGPNSLQIEKLCMLVCEICLTLRECWCIVLLMLCSQQVKERVVVHLRTCSPARCLICLLLHEASEVIAGICC